MSTATEGRDEASAAKPTPTLNQELSSLLRCKRCNLSYAANKSTSALRLTYCSFFCELGDLGFSMSGLETMQRRPAEPVTAPA